VRRSYEIIPSTGRWGINVHPAQINFFLPSFFSFPFFSIFLLKRVHTPAFLCPESRSRIFSAPLPLSQSPPLLPHHGLPHTPIPCNSPSFSLFFPFLSLSLSLSLPGLRTDHRSLHPVTMRANWQSKYKLGNMGTFHCFFARIRAL